MIYYQKNDSCALEVPNSNSILKGILNFFPSVFAQQIESSDKSQNIVKNIEQDVILSLSKVTGLPKNTIAMDSKIFSDLQLGNIGISYINHFLIKTYRISIWDKVWNESNTVEDIVKLATADYYQNVLKKTYDKNRFATTRDILDISKQKYDKETYDKFSNGKSMIEAGKYDYGIQILSPVVETNSSFYLAWLNLAFAFEAEGKNVAAEEAYHKAINANENDDLKDKRIYFKYGSFLFEDGRYNESLIQYNKALEIEPDSLGFRTQINSLILEIKDY